VLKQVKNQGEKKAAGGACGLSGIFSQLTDHSLRFAGASARARAAARVAARVARFAAAKRNDVFMDGDDAGLLANCQWC